MAVCIVACKIAAHATPLEAVVVGCGRGQACPKILSWELRRAVMPRRSRLRSSGAVRLHSCMWSSSSGSGVLLRTEAVAARLQWSWCCTRCATDMNPCAPPQH